MKQHKRGKTDSKRCWALSSCTLYLLISLVMLANTACFQKSWTGHTIDAKTRGTASIYVSDLDSDGDKDIVAAVMEDNDMVWWRNDTGNPIQWTKFSIDTNFSGAISVYATDVDSDGDQDILGAAAVSGEIAWWENDGGNALQWIKHTIRSAYDFAHEVYAHDLDMDGDADVLGASSNLDVISWWRNDGRNPIVWIEQTIGSNFDGAKSVRVADLDADGDNDVVGVCLYDSDVTYWRNDGGDPITWSKFTIDEDFGGAHRVQAVDLDGDQDCDILAAAYYAHQIAWYSNDGGAPINWTKQIIGTGFENACIAQAADLDGDGDLDVAASAQTSDEVAWWRNDGGNPIVWTKFVIDGNFDRVWPLYVCDLDLDNDYDIIAASGWKGINQVKWWENSLASITATSDQRVSRVITDPTNISGLLQSSTNKKSQIYNFVGGESKPINSSPGAYFLKAAYEEIQKIVKIQ